MAEGSFQNRIKPTEIGANRLTLTSSGQSSSPPNNHNSQIRSRPVTLDPNHNQAVRPNISGLYNQQNHILNGIQENGPEERHPGHRNIPVEVASRFTNSLEIDVENHSHIPNAAEDFLMQGVDNMALSPDQIPQSSSLASTPDTNHNESVLSSTSTLLQDGSTASSSSFSDSTNHSGEGNHDCYDLDENRRIASYVEFNHLDQLLDQAKREGLISTDFSLDTALVCQPSS